MRDTIYIVDDEAPLRRSLRTVLEAAGFKVKEYASALRFLSDIEPHVGCLILDIGMPSMDGLELQDELVRRGSTLPIIIFTGDGTVALAVRAMKSGAVDFVEKNDPDKTVLLHSIELALEKGRRENIKAERRHVARVLLDRLTRREREVLDDLLKGSSNKETAKQLGISLRTVETHRVHIIKKMGARNIVDVVLKVLEGVPH